MSRIRKAFDNKKAFIAFVTGGDPDLGTTEALIPQMAAAGADLIEIGILFQIRLRKVLSYRRQTSAH